jgi:pyruvate dehydrogenase E1 component subunit beta
MAIEVLMPVLPGTTNKGKIASWVKSQGDAVRPGDVLAQIETDIATIEVEAMDEGILSEILVPEGNIVSINTPIALIEDLPVAPEQDRVPYCHCPR